MSFGAKRGSSNVNGYTTPRFRRAPAGDHEVDFVQGTTACLGGAYGAVMQSGFSDYEAAYAPGGELMTVVKNEGTGMFSNPYPLRLWRATGTAWMSDLVYASIGTDGVGALHFRADSTPDVLVFNTTRLVTYRKALDVWTSAWCTPGPGRTSAAASSCATRAAARTSCSARRCSPWT